MKLIELISKINYQLHPKVYPHEMPILVLNSHYPILDKMWKFLFSIVRKKFDKQ